MTINIAFTGTQKGMTVRQMNQFLVEMRTRQCEVFRHGVCIGADEQAHCLLLALRPARGRGLAWAYPLRINGYPAIGNKTSRICKFSGLDQMFTEDEPLVRNRAMVDASDMLIATPGEYQEVLRSGTWATIRHAKKTNKLVLIIWPDGTTEVSAGE